MYTENKFGSCSTEMKRMMNRTLSCALITWKQRTTELDASEWRRMQLIYVKALHFLRSTQLQRSFLAWKGIKMLDKGSRLQDRLQDRHALTGRLRKMPVGQDPTIACRLKGQLSAPEWLITPVSNSPKAKLRSVFARIHKSRNAYQVWQTL